MHIHKIPALLKSSYTLFLIQILFRVILSLLLILTIAQTVYSQNNPSSGSGSYNERRFKAVIITESVVTTTIMIGLHYLWYKKFPHSRFHFFNDNSEWLNMDKVGHATTAYNISAIQYDAMRWCGVGNNRSAWIGGLTALGFQTIIEIFDGFSQKWGFSKGDMLANIIGTTLFMAQQFAWKDQRVRLKFSFHRTVFPKFNPDELGKNKWQRWLKDYNGQTYWLSINPSSFIRDKTDFPKWLNVAIGYGAEGMIGASSNPTMIGNTKMPVFKRYRQYYFSLDADLNRIGNLNSSNSLLLSLPNIIKLPAPTFEFTKDSAMKFHPFYF